MPINTIAVLGAGIMGRGIAYASVLGGYRTLLQDTSDQALERGVAVAIETCAQQKVFGRVPAQRELRGQYHVRACGARPFAVPEDLVGVSGKVAYDTVDLGNRDLDDARHPASLASVDEPPRRTVQSIL